MTVTAAELERVRSDARDRVLANKFTKVNGKPTWADRVLFLKECRRIAIRFKNKYTMGGKYGFSWETMYVDEFKALTGLDPFDPEEPNYLPENYETLSDDALKLAQAKLDEEKRDYAMLMGFREGFSENFRETFDKKYWQELRQDELSEYEGLKPIDFIDHLLTKWIKLDTMQIKALKAKFYRGWEEEDLSTFATRLESERKELARLKPAVVVTDVDLCQHYMEQIWGRTDIFTETIMTDWTSRATNRQTWKYARQYFEAEMEKKEAFIASGGQTNQYAHAAAVQDIEAKFVALQQERDQLREEMKRERMESANAVAEVKENLGGKVDRLAEVMLQFAKKDERRSRRKRAVAADDEDTSSSDEEPPTPPPKKKNKRDRKWRRARGADSGSSGKASASFPTAPGKDKEWTPGCTFQRGMTVNREWSKTKQEDFFAARRAFTDTNTAEAMREKIVGIEMLLGRDRSRFNKDELKTSLARWTARLEKKQNE